MSTSTTPAATTQTATTQATTQATQVTQTTKTGQLSTYAKHARSLSKFLAIIFPAVVVVSLLPFVPQSVGGILISVVPPLCIGLWFTAFFLSVGAIIVAKRDQDGDSREAIKTLLLVMLLPIWGAMSFFVIIAAFGGAWH